MFIRRRACFLKWQRVQFYCNSGSFKGHLVKPARWKQSWTSFRGGKTHWSWRRPSRRLALLALLALLPLLLTRS